MTLLLTVLGAVLCSLMVSSEIVPQADFNSQQVRHTTGQFLFDYPFRLAVCFLSQLQLEHLPGDRILQAVFECVIGSI